MLLHQRGDGTYAYDYVNLRAVLSGDADEDKPVLDNDILAVYRIGEAHFTPDHTVKILGDVVAPGLYARGEGMRLSDLLKLAGAYKPGGGTRRHARPCPAAEHDDALARCRRRSLSPTTARRMRLGERRHPASGRRCRGGAGQRQPSRTTRRS